MAHEGQHQSPLELITQNVRSILADVLNKLECGDVDHSIDCSLNLLSLYITIQKCCFQFNGKNYLQIHGTAMGTKMAVAFANIFMAHIETQILSKSVIKPTVGNVTLTTYFRCGTSANQTLKNSSNKPIHITLQLNLRLKSQTWKQHFWIQLYTKATDSRNNLSLIKNKF